jgi:hypothetical protein
MTLKRNSILLGVAAAGLITGAEQLARKPPR